MCNSNLKAVDLYGFQKFLHAKQCQHLVKVQIIKINICLIFKLSFTD